MSTNKLVVCPFDEAHKVKASRIQLHIAKCKLNHLDKPPPFVCPFNATHVLPAQEKDYHLSRCPDKVALERLMTDFDKNNTNKGRTNVPSYSEPILPDTDEVWEIEEETKPGYKPSEEIPIGAIVQPKPLSKPASRRQLYKELHQMPSTLDAKSHVAAKLPPVPRQPKQPSEAERNFEQEANPQYSGLGRGKTPSSRIAANIFSQQPQVDNAASASAQSNYSAVISGMKNLGLGRGTGNKAPANPMVLNDEDFPALGVGRGVVKNPQRQEFKAPGFRW